MFKEDPGFEQSKVYGCSVVGVSIWNSGEQFSDKFIDYLVFISEYVIRKGDEGWKIFSILDNRDGLFLYEQITPYKRKNGVWNKEKVLYVVEKPKESATKEKGNANKKGPLEILLKNQKLKINFGGKSLYKAPNSDLASLDGSNDESIERSLSEAFKESDSGFWIWIESSDSSGHISQLPYPFSVTTNMGKQAKVQDCGIQNYFSEAKGCNKEDVTKWGTEYKKIKQLDKSKIKGKWMEADEICEAGNKRKWDISEDQLTNLKMFCAKSKEES